MNLIDAWVEEVVGEPFEKYGKWCVDVISIDMGQRPQKERLMFNTREEAAAVEKGHKFLH